MEGEFEPVEDLQRVGPGFELPVLVAVDGRPAPEHVQKGARLRPPLQLKPALPEGEFRDEARSRRRGRRRRLRPRLGEKEEGEQ